MRGWSARNVWVFGRIPSTDEEAAKMLPPAPTGAAGDEATERGMAARAWSWLSHPGRLWLIVVVVVVGLVVLSGLSSG